MPRELLLTAPRTLALAAYDERPPAAGELRADAVVSGISLGTELALYRGESPFARKRFDLGLRLFVDDDAGTYPSGLGYEWVGVVRDAGPGATSLRAGQRIHVALPHRETHTFAAEGATAPPWTALPDELDDDRATLLQSAAIALQAVRDARISPGDRIAVFGLGAFGLLATQLARLDGAGFVAAVDPVAARRALAQSYGADAVLDPRAGDPGFELKSAYGAVDIAVEFSGRYAALQQALRSVRVGGTVVAAAFYMGGASDLRLGEEWLHNRLTMIASMQGWGVPSRQEGWDRRRLRAVACELLASGRLRVDELLSEQAPFASAPELYARLDTRSDETLRAILRY
jgi:2-desacetyl-2-hydroxyethyl bacteriochlorophyllide A dehydrogenase